MDHLREYNIMFIAAKTPSADEITGYLDILSNKPILIVGLVVGFLGGAIVILTLQRIGWFPNAKAGEIAKLRTEVEHLGDTVDKLLKELGPWRKFQERLIEKQLQEQLHE